MPRENIAKGCGQLFEIKRAGDPESFCDVIGCQTGMHAIQEPKTALTRRKFIFASPICHGGEWIVSSAGLGQTRSRFGCFVWVHVSI
jgi:hypothetical protein